MRHFLTLILLFVVTSALCASQGDKIAAQKKIIANLQKQVASGEKMVVTLRKDRTQKERQVNALALQINNRNRLLSAQTKQVELLRGEIAGHDKQYRELSGQLTRERELYAEMVCEAYRNYRNNNLMSYIFTSESFTDVARKVVNIRAVSKYREERMLRIETLSKDVAEHRRLLAEQKEALDVVVRDLESEKSKLQRDQSDARKSIKSMSTKEKRLLQDGQMQKKQLEAAVAELRKLSRGNTTGASFSTKTSNLNLPVVGGRVKRYMDNMAEITGAVGAKVNSIYEGKVVDVKHNRITGKYDVYIAHGEYITSYAGLSEVMVLKSDNVIKNQTIGVIGQSVDILTMQTEYKIVFGIYPPNPAQKIKAADCFKK